MWIRLNSIFLFSYYYFQTKLIDFFFPAHIACIHWHSGNANYSIKGVDWGSNKKKFCNIHQQNTHTRKKKRGGTETVNGMRVFGVWAKAFSGRRAYYHILFCCHEICIHSWYRNNSSRTTSRAPFAHISIEKCISFIPTHTSVDDCLI